MTIITLTTDFGQADGYVGIMKGVILGIAPDARLVDISHDISPQNIVEAAYVLRGAAPFFPEGTVHVAVVDPGVGSTREPLLVTTPRETFIGPDNGLLAFALDTPGAQAWVLDRPAFWLPVISRTFHGRDIFAPIAAHLVNGIAPHEVGTPTSTPARLETSEPRRLGNHTILGAVIHVDHFGNLISNIPAAWVADGRWTCVVGGTHILQLSTSYSAARPGEPVALVGSRDTIEVAVRDGSAARHLRAGVGDRFELHPA